MNFRSKIQERHASLSREDGVAIVEALVAAFILVLVSVAVFTAYDASTRGSFNAQQKQVGLSQVQQEIEKLRALPYDEVSLTAMPGSSTDPDSPLTRVSSGQFNLNREGTATFAPLVVNGGANPAGGTISGGTITPTSTFTRGDVSGRVYRFVVWQDNPGCDSATCSGERFKRVIVIVKPDDTAAVGDTAYSEIHSDFSDPERPATLIPPPDEPEPTVQQFYLTDTPCDPDGETLRGPITGNHPLHNTLGNCQYGLQTGTTPGAPDTLVPEPPPGHAGTPVYDYQSDWEPNPNTDKGIQIVPTPPCPWKGENHSQPQTKWHGWLTDPMQSAYELNGHVAFTLYSKTINGVQDSGKFCFWVFKRSPATPDNPDGTDWPFWGDNGRPGTPDDPGWTFHYIRSPSFNGNNGDNSWWPSTWGTPPQPLQPVPETDITELNGGTGVVPAGWRLGLAITVGSNYAEEAPELMYDHPLYPSRLEVATTTPVD